MGRQYQGKVYTDKHGRAYVNVTIQIPEEDLIALDTIVQREQAKQWHAIKMGWIKVSRKYIVQTAVEEYIKANI